MTLDVSARNKLYFKRIKYKVTAFAAHNVFWH